MTRHVFLALALAASLAAPTSAEVKRPETVVVAIAPDVVLVDAARSTYLLPLELSAERLRSEQSNHSGQAVQG